MSWGADRLNPVFDRINMIYRIFEHMAHESMRLESFNTCINPDLDELPLAMSKTQRILAA